MVMTSRDDNSEIDDINRTRKHAEQHRFDTVMLGDGDGNAGSEDAMQTAQVNTCHLTLR